MSSARKSSMPRLFDLPMLIGLGLTVLFYWLVGQESMKDGLLYRYTTEHIVEYVIVAFFLWGLSDVIMRALGFPRELLALRQVFLSSRNGRESVSHAAVLIAGLQKKPQWLQDSRLGQRLAQGLAHLQEKGSADGFADYLRDLADHDEDRTYSNYGVVRFICWVTPMLGFLGTVIHFGTALGGQTAGDIAEKLPRVVAEMGTAFNTTTVALIAATTMMFCLFLSERVEREIVRGVDRRTERELLNRFEVHDASLTPFLSALESANRASLEAMDATIERQMEIWSNALEAFQRQADSRQQWQSQLWEQALRTIQERFEAHDTQRERQLVQMLEAMDVHQKQNRLEVQATVDQVSHLKTDFARLVEALSGIAQGEGELVRLQASLAENLRVLGETQQLDQALHGLTAAIHLITARTQGGPIVKGRAA
jgi:biopolymer transport protein ExbB/TolQ